MRRILLLLLLSLICFIRMEESLFSLRTSTLESTCIINPRLLVLLCRSLMLLFARLLAVLSSSLVHTVLPVVLDGWSYIIVPPSARRSCCSVLARCCSAGRARRLVLHPWCRHRPAGCVAARSLALSCLPPPPLFHRYHMHCFIVGVGWRG
jgi:hypothetical protein